MILSKILLNPKDRQARKDLGNPYELHRTLLRAFATPLPENERVLFRVEYQQTPLMATAILVQSQSLPHWQHIASEFAAYFLTAPEVKTIDFLHFTAGQILRFRLRANPTKREKNETENGKRRGLYQDAARSAWLARKGEAGGFRLDEPSLVIRPFPQRNFSVKDGRQTHKATLNIVDFDGMLEVTDPQRLLEAVMGGIGPAKGLGCGLLSLARTA